MHDEDKTKEELISELRLLRAKVALQNQVTQQNNDSKLWAILDAIHDSMVIMDVNGRVIWVNRHFAQSMNITVEDAIGKTIYDFLPKDIASKRMSKYRTALEKRQHIQFEDERDGKHFHHSAYPIFDNEQNDYLLIFIQNRTAQWQLRATQKQTQRYLDAAASMLLSLNRDAEIVLINKAACELLGYEKEELLGKNWIDTCIPISLRENIKKVFKELINGGVEKLAYYENPVLTKSGEERLIAWHNSILIKGDSGEIEEALSSGVDITERKQAEIALQESEANIRAILEVFPDTMFRLSRDGTHVEFYAPRLSQVSAQADRHFGTTIYDVLLPEIAELYLNAVEKTLDQGQVQVFEYNLDLAQQGLLYYEARMVNVGSEEVLVILRDVTERKKAEFRELELHGQRERIQLLEEVISNLSHDIKTPLANMKTSLYLLEKHADPVKKQQYLRNLDIHIKHLNKLINNIFTVSRLDKDTDLQFAAINLNLLIEIISKTYQIQAKEKGVTLSLELNPKLPYFMGSEEKLEQAIVSLLDNALQHTSSGDSIIIRSNFSETHIALKIQDTGIGINKADLPHIFERFYRADKSRSHSYGSTGLGLAIVKKVAELHGGHAGVESVLGEGSTFCICLPLSSRTT